MQPRPTRARLLPITSSRGHIGPAIRGVLSIGWRIVGVPDGAKLSRNGQFLRLRWANEERAFRLFVYKVTGRGEALRAAERRIEITSTYQKNLEKGTEFKDVVLGYDPETDIFVGIDPRRINLGGRTGNASSNVSPDGLEQATEAAILILPHESNLLGSEYQAYFRPARMSEYLANVESIHRGAYDGRGAFSGNATVHRRTSESVPYSRAGGDVVTLSGLMAKSKAPAWSDEAVWRAFEAGDSKKLARKTSKVDFLELARRQIEIGTKGELHVLKSERRRLALAKRPDLAEKVTWVGQNPYAVYDILSYDSDGAELYIEVKATTGSSRRFQISAYEWTFAKAKGRSYAIYRVTSIEGDVALACFRDPALLVDEGKLKLTTSDWFIKY